MPAGRRASLCRSTPSAHAHYKALFGEVEDLIKDKQLPLVPSGPLTQLPFQVLVTKLPPRPALRGEGRGERQPGKERERQPGKKREGQATAVGRVEPPLRSVETDAGTVNRQRQKARPDSPGTDLDVGSRSSTRPTSCSCPRAR